MPNEAKPLSRKASRDREVDVSSVIAWVLDGAPPWQTRPGAFGELCERLVACGIPLHRGALFARTLHPNILGGRYRWRASSCRVETIENTYEWLQSDEYLRSVIPIIAETGKPVRRRLCDPDCPRDLLQVEVLLAEGATDYYSQPLRFVMGELHAVTWSTAAPGGFTDAMIAALDAINRPVALLTEIFAQRRLMANLLNIYVGHNAGARVLQGAIRRGDIDVIDAAIWISDLRGSTRWADELAGPEYIALLNDHFDCIVPAIERHAGEVLKFTGDGVLAIFPLVRGRTHVGCCEAARDAARDARANTAALNDRRAGRGLAPLRFGLALHIGDVLYGNIGSANRLDFTATGPAVNLAARLGGMTGELGHETLVSTEFAAAVSDDVVPLGPHPLRGFNRAIDLYALR
jgi:adenylate cyclase